MKYEETKVTWGAGVVRNYSDTLFRMIFKEKEALLHLYNAVNRTNYQNPEELQINTLENAVYMNMKNDLSFVFNFSVSLYEQQSTYNPNMPLRDLFYVARLLEKMFFNKKIYSERLIEIPNPRFVVFYNGRKEQPERTILKLSDAYATRSVENDLELKVTMININFGKNEELLSRCRELKEYALYAEKIRKNMEQMPLTEAVEQAISECVREGILVTFLTKNRAEAIQMSIFEYDQEEHMKTIAEEAKEEGIKEGKREGKAEGLMEGIKTGTEKIIQVVISYNQKEGLSKEKIMEKLQVECGLTKEEARAYVEKEFQIK